MLTLVQKIILKQHFITEEKSIIQNALNLMESVLLHRNELFQEMVDFQGMEEIIAMGILICQEEVIRVNFHDMLKSISMYVKLKGKGTDPLPYLLKLLSNKFSLASNHPSKQFFELFSSLIDMHYDPSNQSQQDEQLFNAELLLGQIIDKLISDNRVGKTTEGSQ